MLIVLLGSESSSFVKSDSRRLPRGEIADAFVQILRGLGTRACRHSEMNNSAEVQYLSALLSQQHMADSEINLSAEREKMPCTLGAFQRSRHRFPLMLDDVARHILPATRHIFPIKPLKKIRKKAPDFISSPVQACEGRVGLRSQARQGGRI
jgi:hypothetical protein